MKKGSKSLRNLISLTLASSLVLSACSSSVSDKKTTDKTTEPAPAQTADVAKKEPVKLKFTYWGSPDEKKAIEGATKKFTEKYPWITVEAVSYTHLRAH